MHFAKYYYSGMSSGPELSQPAPAVTSGLRFNRFEWAGAFGDIAGAQLALGSCDFSSDKNERSATLVTAAFAIWSIGAASLLNYPGNEAAGKRSLVLILMRRNFRLPSMLRRIRKYVLFTLLLLVPLQGLAAMLHALGCVPQTEHVASASMHQHAAHDHGGPQHHDDKAGGTSSSDHASHQCCHHFTAVPVYPEADGRNTHSVFSTSLAPFQLSAVLEQPQRPPRS